MANQPEQGVSPVVLVGGVVLLAGVAVIAYREYHKNHPNLPPEARPREGGSDDQPEEVAQGQDTGGKNLLQQGVDAIAETLGFSKNATPSPQPSPDNTTATGQRTAATPLGLPDVATTPTGDIASTAAARTPRPAAHPSARSNRYNMQAMHANRGQWRDAVTILRALGHQLTHAGPADTRMATAIARFQVAYAADAAAHPDWQPRSLTVDGELGPAVKAALANYRPMVADVAWES